MVARGDPSVAVLGPFRASGWAALFWLARISAGLSAQLVTRPLAHPFNVDVVAWRALKSRGIRRLTVLLSPGTAPTGSSDTTPGMCLPSRRSPLRLVAEQLGRMIEAALPVEGTALGPHSDTESS